MQETQTPVERVDPASLYSVDALAAKYPAVVTAKSLRWQLRHRDENGLARACVKVGKKLLIEEPRWCEWLAQRREAK
jgi:hypothetical protein